MTKLVECPGCARHVRADDGHCPFCGRASTTAAPGRMLALVLPLTLMACTSNEPPPKPAADGGKATPTPVEPVADDGKIEPVADDGKIEPVPAEPAYGVPDDPEPPTDVIDPEPEPIDRPADKYGAPPMMDSPTKDEPKDVIEPEPTIKERHKTKYGGPPRPKSPTEKDPF